MEAFQSILEILNPYLLNTKESQRISRVLETTPVPDYVVNWFFEVGSDSTGDPAIWIYFLVTDEAAARPDLTKAITDVDHRIRERLAQEDIHRWPYVRVRTVSEQSGLLRRWLKGGRLAGSLL